MFRWIEECGEKWIFGNECIKEADFFYENFSKKEPEQISKGV